jgi:hypothetical protein
MVKNFNIESEKPQFIYKRNPLVKHAFQIFMFKDEKGDYEPVGDYTLLDMSEALDLTEKKVMKHHHGCSMEGTNTHRPSKFDLRAGFCLI